jgi:thioredoxin 1
VAQGIIHITDGSFAKDVLEADKPVIVDFWAEWCGPCRMIEPAMEELAGEYGDRMVFAKMNIDDEPEASMRYGVQSIPTLLVFSKGKPVAQMIGARPRTHIEQLIESALAATA